MQQGISEDCKVRHLSKIVDSAVLARSAQLRRLLKWLGDSAIAGDRVHSEYEVGVQALGRSEQFDPQTESVVRKEIRRLRGKLEEYYRVEGRGDKIRVRFAGPYNIAFAPVERTDPAPTAGQECVLALPPLAPPEASTFAALFYDELLLGFAGASDIALVSRTTARGYGAQAGDIREIAASCGADYVIESAIHLSGDEVVVTMWVVNGTTGRLHLPLRIAARREAGELASKSVSGMLERLERARADRESVTFDHVCENNLELKKVRGSEHT